MRVVKRRLLYATGVALAIAAILGSAAAASLHARRIRRLERAANRIAQGEFDEPVVDLGGDELGELAAAFERMRVQLAQLDTARKEFVANASHELRTPLFSLAGFLELMADEDLDEETRAGFLATTREQVERLTKLAADLLDLSRMDAGRLRVEREEVSLADMARLLADELAPLAEATGHRLDGRSRPRGLGGRRRGAGAPDRPRAGRERALAHPAGHRGRRHGDEGRRAGSSSPSTTTGPGSRRSTQSGSSTASTGSTARRHRAAASVSPSRASSRAHMDGTVELSSTPGRTTFTLSLPAAAVPVPELAVST